MVLTTDHRIMRRVHRWHAPRWIQLWMLAATRCGDGWLYAALALVLFAAGDSFRYKAILASSLALALGVLLFMVLKQLVGRTRPCDLEPHCWASLLPPDRFSFPSGHSISAFAVMVPLSYYYPSFTWPFYFCAGSIAASRILLGMHFLSDVVFGSALGAALGYWSFHALT